MPNNVLNMSRIPEKAELSKIYIKGTKTPSPTPPFLFFLGTAEIKKGPVNYSSRNKENVYQLNYMD